MATRKSRPTGPADLCVQLRTEDGAVVVSIAGELDLSTAGALREVLVLPEVMDAPSVRLDLTEVAFLGSLGIGVLVSVCKRVKASGGMFSMSCRQETKRVLEIAGLIDYLHVDGAE